ncbi:bifunctional 4-hydroxy-2-oxoglutarate aldolase/2-dehydro-3-deoxy-phosphogluconate aldolase [Aliikangiella coralliicola]|uniref:2-dehydro-3-deoxy-phosphogluconate aldolase n=1 Tax=Aliikangiella coralliicola TaxID=2592383 RepID=A0A545UHJ3_9GAMM|nr:bifunctional 4-hydroxy-2-oxoglutarate aldolase/2-dehydro-3-deoxy-phosphogluconate aldolase [Aliikangiella coralliicola]TQV88932.1 bifunctional 4-hydroxy-2-oxoglutarate aldolase/2-dehydro-3-deoxy-phosphogluconate aldolase [Aliikangiella coralliicola]
MNLDELENYLSLSAVIPVIVIEDAENAVPLAAALIEGGISIIEITLRSDCALNAIEQIRKNIPNMCVGAGTVNNVDAIEKSVAAGAQFLVCPGVTKPLLDAAKYHSIPLLPGAATPTEAMQLQLQGYNLIKFFPAEAAGGVDMLKSLAGPLPDIKFCPTGGINNSNFNQYLTIKNVICVGSSWVADKDLINTKNWPEVTRRAREVSNLTTHRGPKNET